MRLTLFGGFSFGENMENYGKTVIIPGGYGRIGEILHGLLQIGVYRVKMDKQF